MKIAKLLVLGVVLLLSGKALAVDGNVWQKPAEPAGVNQFVNYAENDTLYMYNVAAKMFFVGGNDYNTRASVGPLGYKVIFVNTDQGLELRDSVETQSTVKCTFSTADAAAIWVDNSTETYRFWEVIPSNGDAYRIKNPVSDAGTYLGWKGSLSDTRLYFVDPVATPEAGVDWKFVSPAVYKAYADSRKDYDAKMDVYNEAMALKELLDYAESISANVADQVTVYNNTASTKEELTAAIAAAKVAIAEREKELAEENINNATVANPVNVTSLFIVNPTFTDNKFDGWMGDPFGAVGGKENAEHYQKNYSTWQMLENLPQGVYKFNAHAFYRAGQVAEAYKNYKEQNATAFNAKIFAAADGDSLTTAIASPFSAQLTESLGDGTWSTATDAETGVTYYIPNNMIAADALFSAGYCNDNAVFMSAGEDGTMRVGVSKNVTTGGDWSIFDDFSLTYYGNAAEAYQMWLDEIMKQIKDVNIEEGDIFTASYLEAYNTARSGEKKAASKAEVLNVLAPILEASSALDKNLKLWKEYKEVLDLAKSTAANPGIDPAYTEEQLGDWADFEGAEALVEHTMTNEELEAIIAEKRAAIAEAMTHPLSEQDMTNLLVNPDFEKGDEGWTREAASGGNVATGGSDTNRCYEAWNNAGFDIYQVVKNAPKGVYEISVQGFYRYGRTAYQSYVNKEQYTTPETCPVFVYLNDNTTPFTNVYGDPVQITDAEFYGNGSSSETGADGVTYYFPNDMNTSAKAFSAGMYTQSAYGLVTEDGGQLRIGVKGVSNQLGDSWCIWDNFKLVWKGFNADVIKPVLETNIAKAKEDLSAPIGKDVAQKLSDAIKVGEDAIAKGDGQGMFDALSALFATANEVKDSKTLFAGLQSSYEDLAARIGESVSAVSVVSEANALLVKIGEGMESHTFADSDVEGLELEIAMMMSRLGIPEDVATATDESPVDVTTAVINPYCQSKKGWEGSPAYDNNAQDAEKFNSKYNVYQRIYGLPAGVYTVSVDGFYRAGEGVDDYTSFLANPAEKNHAFLYAVGKGDTCSVAIKRLASEAKELTDPVADGYLKVGDTAMVPNNMTSAGTAFQDGFYKNNIVTVKLGEDDVLTIGLKKAVAITNDWTIWGNWNVTYYGANSTKQPDGDPSKITDVEQVEVETVFYNLKGMRISQPQKGIAIMKQTMSDGTLKVKKVNLK